MNYKEALKYLLAVALMGVVGVLLYRHGAFKLIHNISLPEYALALLILFLAYLVTGYQLFYLLKHQTTTTLSTADAVLLPFSMNIFGYVIPANGGMLFSVLFLKAKYRIDLIQIVSVGFGQVFIMLMLNGIIGLICCFLAELHVIFLISSVIILLSPFFAWILERILSQLHIKKGTWLFRLKMFTQEALRQSVMLIRNRKVLLVMMATSFANILLNILFYYQLNHMLSTGMSLGASSITIILLNISFLVRFVPGNFGVEELLASAIFGLMGNDPATGAMVTLLMRAINLSLAIPLGILHTVINYKAIAEPLLQLRRKK